MKILSYFQRGHIYREIPLEGNHIVPGDFKNNGIGWSLDLDKFQKIVKDIGVWFRL